MALQFNGYGPDPGNAIRERWSNGLDSIINEYYRAKQSAQQSQQIADARALQDLQLRQQYGGVNPITDLTQDQRTQGLAGPSITPAQPEIAPAPARQFVGQIAQNNMGPMMGQPTQDPRQALGNLMAPPTPGSPAVPEQKQYAEHPGVRALQMAVDAHKARTQAEMDALNAGTLEKTAKAKKDIADANLADRKPFDIQTSEKNAQFHAKRFTQLGDALDPSKARAGAFGTSKQVYDRAERLQTLANAYRDNNLDSRQVEELAIGLNSMLSGSNVGAASQVEKLVPKSIMGDKQKLMEWLTNEPKGTNQQEFVKRMLGSIEREKNTASDQIKRTQFERIARYGDLENADPDEFINVLQSAGVDPMEYKSWKKGGYKKASAVQAPEAGGASSGLTPAEQAELDALSKRFGGK